MTKEELKEKYSNFIADVSEILGLGKPIDVLKLCQITDRFFRPLQDKVTDFDENRWEECAKGIHFFMQRKEAIDYDIC